VIAAITATAPWLEAEVDPRFACCPYFLLVNTVDMTFESVRNPNCMPCDGENTRPAEWMMARGAECILTGRCSPEACRVLAEAGVKVITGCKGSVRAAVESWAKRAS
jgi:predicted Fe-Mo cluster-binding NifX family protein